jgi:hypothetical protein
MERVTPNPIIKKNYSPTFEEGRDKLFAMPLAHGVLDDHARWGK